MQSKSVGHGISKRRFQVTNMSVCCHICCIKGFIQQEDTRSTGFSWPRVVDVLCPSSSRSGFLRDTKIFISRALAVFIRNTNTQRGSEVALGLPLHSTSARLARANLLPPAARACCSPRQTKPCAKHPCLWKTNQQ